jgi:hypothetical protein
LLDNHELNDLLEDECYYQDMTKTSFLIKQKQIFQYCQKQGDAFLNLSNNIWIGCLCNEPVFVLSGNNSGNKYEIYIEFVNDEIVDVFLCSRQSDNLG